MEYVKGEESGMFECARGCNEMMLKMVAENIPLGETKLE